MKAHSREFKASVGDKVRSTLTDLVGTVTMCAVDADGLTQFYVMDSNARGVWVNESKIEDAK